MVHSQRGRRKKDGWAGGLMVPGELRIQASVGRGGTVAARPLPPMNLETGKMLLLVERTAAASLPPQMCPSLALNTLKNALS
mmetsp:Transcript_27103/g.53223  ORF Transcript_27103/g.53223 Transcript_27103/m.53223 type:complete len:82 (-) Transcript_27103:213-458(-)